MDSQYTVLFVDDEENILAALRRGLYEEEYNCLFVNSGPAALELMAKEPVSVIVSDMRMPGMDGLHLLRTVKELYPRTVRIVLSGFTQLQQILTTINQAGIFKFITKPWMMDEELKVVLREALDYVQLMERKDELEQALRMQNAAFQNMLKKLDVTIESAARQSALTGAVAHDMLVAITERQTKACSESVKSIELKTLGELLLDTSGTVVGDPTDRTDSDLLNLYRHVFSAAKDITSVSVPSDSSDLPLRYQPKLLESIIRSSTAAIVGHLGTCVIKVTCQKETHHGMAMNAVTVLYAKTRTNSASTRNPDPDETDALIFIVGQTLEPLMQTQNGHFVCRRAEVNIIVKYLLPIALPSKKQ